MSDRRASAEANEDVPQTNLSRPHARGTPLIVYIYNSIGAIAVDEKYFSRKSTCANKTAARQLASRRFHLRFLYPFFPRASLQNHKDLHEILHVTV